MALLVNCCQEVVWICLMKWVVIHGDTVLLVLPKVRFGHWGRRSRFPQHRLQQLSDLAGQVWERYAEPSLPAMRGLFLNPCRSMSATVCLLMTLKFTLIDGNQCNCVTQLSLMLLLQNTCCCRISREKSVSSVSPQSSCWPHWATKCAECWPFLPACGASLALTTYI